MCDASQKQYLSSNMVVFMVDRHQKLMTLQSYELVVQKGY